MSSRIRQSMAPPMPSQRSSIPSTATAAHYEPPQFTLNPAAQRQLEQLSKHYNLNKLQSRYENAQAGVSNSAADVNERLAEREKSSRKVKTRQKPSQSQEGGEDVEASVLQGADAHLDELREQVASMTRRMEESIRKLIDGRYQVQQMDQTTEDVHKDARRVASTQASTVDTRSQVRSRINSAGEEEEFEDFTPTDPAGGTQAVPSASDAFARKLEDAKTRYQNFSHRKRYAEDNDYRKFKQVVHEASHPDGEPLPHESTWFAEPGAAPAPGMTGPAAGEEDSDDDIQIQRATTSTKCPLTLREFEEPLTSSKCQHSFESSAILDMIAHSNERLGGHAGRGGQTVGGEKAVRCPVPSCAEMLTKGDLHQDVATIRRIKRLQNAKRLDEEDDEDGAVVGRREVAEIEDDGDVADVDDYEDDDRTKVKRELASTTGSRGPPSGTAPRSTGVVVDLGESTGEEDEDEDEDEEMDD